MNFKTILCPIDFSDSSDAAIGYASLLASESGARLFIVHVEEPLPEYPPDFAGYGIGSGASEEEQLFDLLGSFQPTVEGVEFEHRHLKGSPASEILRFAEQEKIELIVMGTHGRKGLSRFLMGSVAESIVRRAQCPVLTIKQPVTEPEAVSAAEKNKQDE